MKNFILSGMIVCAATFAGINKTYAQNTKPRVGFKVGVDDMTLGSMNKNGTVNGYHYRIGLQIGLYADLPINNKLSFMPQALFTQKGGKLKNAIVASNTTMVDGEIDYLELPLLITFKPVPKLTIAAGPQASFFLSQGTTRREVGSFDIVNGSNYTNNGFTKVLIGGNLGVGYNFYKNFGLNLHYTRDFQSPGNGNGILMNGERNSGFALTVSYLFN
ncbi:porin family protein [Mucilaginibacter panaciglaebae]|uniref:Outer membrane protein beta-barrel domain-containing protein n=1 Tax=Mucilaginibacter panaciglaebae TaxID=502331 RepID=A0ABP7WVR7_9SPHI